MASLVCEAHVNLIHANGIWTTRCTGVPDLHDPAIAITIGGFLVACMTEGDKAMKKKQDLSQSPFQDPIVHYKDFVPSPAVLNQLVKNLKEQCDEIGLVTFGELLPLHVLLAEFAHLPIAQYRPLLISWICQHVSEILPVQCWLTARGLTLNNYILHLEEEGMADGLEVWLVSLAMGTPINMVLEDVAWCSEALGIDFSYYTLILTSFGMAVLCLPEEQEQGQADNVDNVTDAADVVHTDPRDTKHKQGGHPIAALCIDDGSISSQSVRHASDTDIDVEYQFSSASCD